MNTKALMQQDTLSRQKIVENIYSNFFVEAGAGSGKTTILVKRMVAMVEQGLDVSKICAITFTKAAAGEFYDRFQKALIERSTAPTVEGFVQKPGELGNPNNVTRERCLKALNDIDLCFMGTIDSFCNMIHLISSNNTSVSCLCIILGIPTTQVSDILNPIELITELLKSLFGEFVSFSHFNYLVFLL